MNERTQDRLADTARFVDNQMITLRLQAEKSANDVDVRLIRQSIRSAIRELEALAKIVIE